MIIKGIKTVETINIELIFKDKVIAFVTELATDKQVMRGCKKFKFDFSKIVHYSIDELETTIITRKYKYSFGDKPQFIHYVSSSISKPK